VQSLLRAMALLEILSEDDEGYRLVDLAARAGLSTSTTHRLLTTLEQKQFVQFNRDTSLWFVGVRCFSIGSAFARRRNFAALALPLMRRLRDETGETVNLGLLDQGDVVIPDAGGKPRAHARDHAPGWPLAAPEHRDGPVASVRDG
jgi:IclR family acetate operon transcriptional repressor